MALFLRFILLVLLFSVYSFAQQKDTLSFQTVLNSYENKDYASALKQALCLKDLYLDNENDKMLFKTLRLIGNCHKSTGNYKKSRTCYLAALEGFVKLKDTAHLIIVNNNLAKLYYPLHDFDSLIYYSKESLLYNKELKDTLSGISSYSDLVGVYVYQKKYDLAISYGDKTLELLGDQNYRYDTNLTLLYNNMGNLYYGMEKFNTAHEYYTKSYHSFNNNISLRLKNYVIKNLASTYIMLGDKNKAQHFVSEALSMRDSVNRVNYNSKITEIEYKYNQEKAVSIEALKTKDERQKNKHLQILLLVIILIALLICSIVYFYYYKNKNKKNSLALHLVNQQLNQYQKLKKMQLHNKNKVLDAIAVGKEAERMSISQFLHDSVGALLSSANMHLQVVKKNSKNNTEELQKSQDIIIEASDKIRDLSHQLISSSLIKFGLIEGVKVLCEKYSNVELVFELYCENEIPRFSQSFELKMYNIIEELLNNVIKHSKASESLITLDFVSDKQLTLLVEDNGIGFDKNKVEFYEGIGLSQIRSRIESQNGTFKITSKLKKYTIIAINIPVVY